MIRRQTTKELIAESLKDLFKSKAANKITVREITENCGITPTTFYKYFQDKYDLIIWIYAEPVKNIVNRIGSGEYTLRNAILDVISYFAENRKFLINAIMHTKGQDSFINHVFKIHFEVMREFLKANQNLEELPLKVEVLLKMWVFGSVQIICEWLVNDMSIPIEKFATYLEEGAPEPLKHYLYKI